LVLVLLSVFNFADCSFAHWRNSNVRMQTGKMCVFLDTTCLHFVRPLEYICPTLQNF